MAYNSAYTGAQIDAAVGAVLEKESAWDAAGGGSPAGVSFAASDWTQGSGGYTLTIPQTAHGRKNGDFGYRLGHTVDGVLLPNTWAVLETRVSYAPDTGDIVLTGSAAYDGRIVFFG